MLTVSFYYRSFEIASCPRSDIAGQRVKAGAQWQWPPRRTSPLVPEIDTQTQFLKKHFHRKDGDAEWGCSPEECLYKPEYVTPEFMALKHILQILLFPRSA
jgi:hypothetical protein